MQMGREHHAEVYWFKRSDALIDHRSLGTPYDPWSEVDQIGCAVNDDRRSRAGAVRIRPWRARSKHDDLGDRLRLSLRRTCDLSNAKECNDPDFCQSSIAFVGHHPFSMQRNARHAPMSTPLRKRLNCCVALECGEGHQEN